MHFASLGHLALHLNHIAERTIERQRGALAFAGRYITRVSQRKFGVYQRAAGPFSAWPELADATKEDRLRKGFTENDPLLRTGATRGSFGYRVQGVEAVIIGSRSRLMPFHEFGTSRMPARPVLGPAALESMDYLASAVGHYVWSGFFNYTSIPGVEQDVIEGIGYDGDA